MIQDITPHWFNGEYHEYVPGAQDYLLYFDDDKVLLSNNPEGKFSFPRLANLPEEAALQDTAQNKYRYLFSIDKDRFFLGSPHELANTKAHTDAYAIEGFSWEKVYRLRTMTPTWMGFTCVTAHQLYLWYRGHTCCGRCGTKTIHSTKERALACPSCGELVYPKIAPVIIAAVTNKDSLLMTRYASGPYRRYALVAGYVEIGETFEDALRREVLEETGVHVKNIRYYKSQPWGLSSSLLAGYFCDLDGDPHITMDTTELEEALWLKRDRIPAPDDTLSLTAEMIEVFRTDSLDRQA